MSLLRSPRLLFGISRSLSPSTLIGILILLKILSVHCQLINRRTGELFNRGHGHSSDGTIAGGEKSLPGEFKFMAALGWFDESGNLAFHAGGMLIGPKMVLTAAHCAYKDGKLPDLVYVGGISFSKENPIMESSEHWVANVTIHPHYDPKQGYHDIAILELDRVTQFGPICILNNPSSNIKDVTAIGYGLTEFAGKGSLDLLKVNLTVFSHDICKPFFERQRKFKMGLSDAHICAGDEEGIKDTSQGDSGGPLVVRYEREMFAVGVTSSGQACSGFPPGVYTKISPYIEWITSVLKERGEVLETCQIPDDMSVFLQLRKHSHIYKQSLLADF